MEIVVLGLWSAIADCKGGRWGSLWVYLAEAFVYIVIVSHNNGRKYTFIFHSVENNGCPMAQGSCGLCRAGAVQRLEIPESATRSHAPVQGVG